MSPKQVLRITPKGVLKFMGPYRQNNPPCAYIDIENPSRQNVVWRMLCTAPYRYTVKPRAGIILSGGSKNIQVIFRLDRASREMEDDKLKIQDFILPPGCTDADRLWAEIDRRYVMETRFTVYFGVPTAPRLTLPSLHYDPSSAQLPKLRSAPIAQRFQSIAHVHISPTGSCDGNINVSPDVNENRRVIVRTADEAVMTDHMTSWHEAIWVGALYFLIFCCAGLFLLNLYLIIKS